MARNKSISDTADVFSGHITFEKRDNHNNILAGAKFVVKNLDGQYAKAQRQRTYLGV